MKKIDGDIMATLTLIAKENQYDIQRKIGFDSEAPVVCEYESLMMLCTYIASQYQIIFMFDNRIIGSQLLKHFAGSCHNRYVGLIYICILHIFSHQTADDE